MFSSIFFHSTKNYPTPLAMEHHRVHPHSFPINSRSAGRRRTISSKKMSSSLVMPTAPAPPAGSGSSSSSSSAGNGGPTTAATPTNNPAAQSSSDLDPVFVRALRLLHSRAKDSTAQLRAMLDEAIRHRKGLGPGPAGMVHR